MDGKGRCMDNVFVERLWRTVKHDEICLTSYRSQVEAETNLAAFFRFYNERRPHSAHDRDGRHFTPMEVYRRDLPAALSARNPHAHSPTPHPERGGSSPLPLRLLPYLNLVYPIRCRMEGATSPSRAMPCLT